MEKRVERYFPGVLKITEEVFKEEIKKGGIPNEFKGYISSFGSRVLQNGVLPAVAYIEKADSNTNREIKKIADVIKLFLKKEYSSINDNDKLVEAIRKLVQKGDSFDREKLRIIEGKVIDISIALKLAIRTYLEVKGGN